MGGEGDNPWASLFQGIGALAIFVPGDRLRVLVQAPSAPFNDAQPVRHLDEDGDLIDF
jgi:hypothetical protein